MRVPQEKASYDNLSLSSRSRSSSVFSLDSSASSFTSNSPSPRLMFDEKYIPEKINPNPAKPLVLQWKPQLLSSAFTHHTSTPVRFTAFPPCDVKGHLSEFDSLSWRSAISLLHDTKNPTSLSIFAGPHSLVTPVSTIPIPSALPAALIDLLHNGPEWQLFVVSEAVPVPVGLNMITACRNHHVAIKKLPNGVERYIFGPTGLSIHSLCHLVDVGRPSADSVPPEILYLEEQVEVLCSMALKRFYTKTIPSWIEETHQLLRVQWDRIMLREWATLRSVREMNLLD